MLAAHDNAVGDRTLIRDVQSVKPAQPSAQHVSSFLMVSDRLTTINEPPGNRTLSRARVVGVKARSIIQSARGPFSFAISCFEHFCSGPGKAQKADVTLTITSMHPILRIGMQRESNPHLALHAQCGDRTHRLRFNKPPLSPDQLPVHLPAALRLTGTLIVGIEPT